MSKKIWTILLTIALLLPLLGVSPAMASPPTGGVRFIVQLEAPALLEWGGVSVMGMGGKIDVSSPTAQAYIEQLKAQQAAFVASLEKAIPGAGLAQYVDEKGVARDLSYQIAFNGVTVVLPDSSPSTLKRLARLPGIKAIYAEREYVISMDASLPLLGLVNDANGNGFDPTDADAGLWALLGGHENAGAGLKVALLDTGIAQDHPFFDPTGYTYPAGFPKGDTRYTTPKVIVARGYYRASDPPVYPNPYDYNGHGSHTGGTIAGNYGTVATVGTITQTVSGIAPKAYLMNYQLFYKSQSGSESAWTPEILKAFDDLVADGADVTSNSWSGADNLAPAVDPLIVAVNNIADAGIVPVFAAGNSGPGYGSLHPPAAAEKAIAVGASTTARSYGNTLDVTAPSDPPTVTIPVTLTTILAVESAFTPPITQTFGPYTYVYVGRLEPGNFEGCSAYGAAAAAEIAGKIALISRGTCRFDTKVQNAYDAGAVGVVVFNNVPNAPPITMAGDSRPIPAFMVGNNQGWDLVAWEAQYPGTAALRINYGTSRVPNAKPADIMASFSGRGPFLDLLIKPDVVAPGVDILSAGYNPSTDKVDGWEVIQGTSMATPHVAGAAVLLKQLHPTWSVAQIKSALMSTATGIEGTLYNDYPQTDIAGVMDRGAGRIDLSKAGDPGLTFDKPSVSFGQMKPGETKTIAVQATNVYTTAAQTYSIAISETGDITTTANFTLSTNVSSLAVDGSGATFSVIMEIPATANPGDYEGTVWLRHGSHVAHIPVWVRVQPAAPVADVLIIDDDASAYGFPDYLDYYTDALDALGLTYDIWSADLMDYFYGLGIPDVSDLQQYRAVLWFTGDSWYTYYGIGAAVERRHVMMDYLRSGGRLLAFGQDFSGYELGGAYGRAYLIPLGFAAEPVEDAFDMSTGVLGADVRGLNNSPFAGMYLDLSSTAGVFTSTQEYVDELVPYAEDNYGNKYGGEAAFEALVPGATAEGAVGVIRHLEPTLANKGVLDGPDYRTAYLAFGLEGINETTSATSRTDLLEALYEWLVDEVTVSIEPGAGGAVNELTAIRAEAESSVNADFVGYCWDFGDGSEIACTSDPVAYHNYAEPGTYTVWVEATDEYGHKAISSEEVVINASVDAVKTASTDTAFPGDLITYTIVIHNNSLTETINVLMVDPIPEYTEYVTHTVATRVATTGTAGLPGGGTMALEDCIYLKTELGTLGVPARVITVTLTVRVKDDVVAGTEIVNTARFWVGDENEQFVREAKTAVWGSIFLPVVMKNY